MYSRGLVKTEVNALGAAAAYTRDGMGNVTIMTDADGNVVEYSYNTLNLVENINYGDHAANYVYDKTGALVEMTDRSGVTVFTLDALKRLAAADANGRVTGYAYDNIGNVTQITYPDAGVVTYAYDAESRITKVTDADSAETAYTYDLAGNVKSMVYPTGQRNEYTYNDLGQLTEMKEILGGSTQKQHTYSYSDTGNVLSEQTSTVGFNKDAVSKMYQYDAAGQLTQTTDARYGTTKYQYDTAGNLIRETNGADVTDYRYNKLNQLVSKTTPEGSFVYEYDKRGNLIVEKQGGTVMYTYEYDASNRMVKGVNVSTDETSEYIYNGLGMRVANVQTTQNASYGARSGDNNGIGGNSGGSVLIGDMNVYALDGRPVGVQRTFMDNFGLTRQSKPAIINREYVIDYTNPYNRDLMVYEEGSYVTSYTYGLGLNRISQTVMNYPNKTEVGIEGQNSYTDLAMEKYAKLYFHQDRLGSTIRMTRENGTTIAWADYDEWGKPRSPRDHSMNMAGVDNAIGFTSYTYDVVLDKYFAQARMYDANNRRFAQEDPIRDGANWYTYAGNSPIVFVDPTGKVAVELSVMLVLAVGTVMIVSAAWLYTPEGQRALISGATALFDGSIIVGMPRTENAQEVVARLKGDANSGTGSSQSTGGNMPGSPRPPKRSSIEKAIRKLNQQVNDHIDKLEKYIKNPDAYDNLELLKNAKNQLERDSIINRRIGHLQHEIETFTKQIVNYTKELSNYIK